MFEGESASYDRRSLRSEQDLVSFLMTVEKRNSTLSEEIQKMYHIVRAYCLIITKMFEHERFESANGTRPEENRLEVVFFRANVHQQSLRRTAKLES